MLDHFEIDLPGRVHYRYWCHVLQHDAVGSSFFWYNYQHWKLQRSVLDVTYLYPRQYSYRDSLALVAVSASRHLKISLLEMKKKNMNE